MSKKTIFFIAALVLQVVILGSFFARYEYLKNTGDIVYIPVVGYDPTDLFRGDYVNVSYELPYQGAVPEPVWQYDDHLLFLKKDGQRIVAVLYGVSGETSPRVMVQNSNISPLDAGFMTRFSVASADRFFVQDKTGLDLENKIREGNMWAKWSLHDDGTVVLLDIVDASNVPQ